MTKPTQTHADRWVKCPICREPDMRCTPEGEACLIQCTNTGCASNNPAPDEKAVPDLKVIARFVDAKKAAEEFLPERTHENMSEWFSAFTHHVNYRLAYGDWERLEAISEAMIRASSATKGQQGENGDG